MIILSTILFVVLAVALATAFVAVGALILGEWYGFTLRDRLIAAAVLAGAAVLIGHDLLTFF